MNDSSVSAENNSTVDTLAELQHKYDSAMGRIAPLQRQNEVFRQEAEELRNRIKALESAKATEESTRTVEETINAYADRYPDVDKDFLKDTINTVVGLVGNQKGTEPTTQVVNEDALTARSYLINNDENIKGIMKSIEEDSVFNQWASSNTAFQDAINGFNTSATADGVGFFKGVLTDAYKAYKGNNTTSMSSGDRNATIGGLSANPSAGVEIRDIASSNVAQSKAEAELAEVEQALLSRALTPLQRSELYKRKVVLKRQLQQL